MLLTIGPVHELLQDEVYALPTRLCYITVQTESGTVFISNDNDNWIEVTLDDNSGFITGAAFIKIEDDNAIVTAKTTFIADNIQGPDLQLNSLLLQGVRTYEDFLLTLLINPTVSGSFESANIVSIFPEFSSVETEKIKILYTEASVEDSSIGSLVGFEVVNSIENSQLIGIVFSYLELNIDNSFISEDLYFDYLSLTVDSLSTILGSLYGRYLSIFSPGADIPVIYGDFITDLAGSSDFPYYLWLDSRGVLRILEQDDQAKLALYDPLFDPKYTPGEENFQRFILQWVAGKIQLGFEVGGSGVLGNVELLGAAIEGNFMPPTSDPGVAGVIWNNGGTLAISAG